MSEDQLGQFLEDIRGQDGLHVASICPETRQVTGRVYAMPGQGLAAAQWLHGQNEQGRNCYYTPNPVAHPDKRWRSLRKPGKADILRAEYLHVDVDPDGEGTYDEQRARLLNGRLSSVEASGPYTVVDSGNGVQALYRLDHGLPADEAEERNNTLLIELGGDPGTFNVDRLLRAPFTVNYSDEAKIRKGYPVATDATVRYLDPGRVTEAGSVPRTPVPATSDATWTRPGEPDDPGAVLAFLELALQENQELAARWHGDNAGLEDTSCSGRDRSIAQLLKLQGMNFDQFAYAVRHAPTPAAESHYQDDQGNDRYLWRAYRPDHGEPLSALPQDVFDDYELPPAEQAKEDAITRPFELQQFPVDLLTPGRIEARPYLYGKYLLRGKLSTLIGTGGVSKSVFGLVMATGLALGRDLLSITDAPLRPRRVVMLNNEDDQQEMWRRMAAVFTHYGLTDAEQAQVIAHVRLVPFTAQHVRLIEEDETGVHGTRALAHLVRCVQAFEADVLSLDPLVSLHTATENDANGMQSVAGVLIGVCAQCSVAGLVMHHTRKGASDGTPQGADDASRGSTAVTNAARVNFMLSKMTAREAEQLGIDEDDVPRLVRLDEGKQNYSLAAARATWVYLNTVHLPFLDTETGEIVTQDVGVPGPVGDRVPSPEDVADRRAEEQAAQDTARAQARSEQAEADAHAVDDLARDRGTTSAAQLRPLLGMSRDRFECARARLVEVGAWSAGTGGHGGRYERVPDSDRDDW